MKKQYKKTKDKVKVLTPEEIRNKSRKELSLRARTISEGGTRPDGMTREEWRVTQGSYYDDDRC